MDDIRLGSDVILPDGRRGWVTNDDVEVEVMIGEEWTTTMSVPVSQLRLYVP